MAAQRNKSHKVIVYSKTLPESIDLDCNYLSRPTSMSGVALYSASILKRDDFDRLGMHKQSSFYFDGYKA